MYVIENYPSKKLFLADVKRLQELHLADPELPPELQREKGRLEARLQVWTPGPFGVPDNGTGVVEGPHFPQAHRFYVQVTVKDGVVVKAK